MAFSKQEMAARAAQEIPSGSVVNLGIGLPTLIADYIDPAANIWLQSENGLLGMGPFPVDGEEDPQLINAGKQTVTVLAGGSFFDSALSFTMIRGGHIDLVFLGAMQVSCAGDLANWSVPGGRTMGIGGAMDLAAGAKRAIAVMTHTSKAGHSKLQQACTYPLTAQGAVDRVITSLGVFDCAGQHFQVVELAPGVTLDQVRAATGAPVHDGQ